MSVDQDPVAVSKDPNQLTVKELLIEFRAEARGEFAALRDTNETRDETSRDHEARLRTLEDRLPQFISWKQFFGGLAGLGAFGAAIVTVLAFMAHITIS